MGTEDRDRDRDIAERLHDAVAELVRVHQTRDRDRICCHGISVRQCHALERLVERGGSRLNQLAQHLMLDKSTTSRVVDGLEAKRLVRRVDDPEDGRAVRLIATPDGVRLHQRIRSELVEEERRRIADLSPEAREGAIELLHRLSAMKRRPAKAGGSPCDPGESREEDVR